MLTAIEDETLHWTCLLYDEADELVSCGMEKQAHISEARYLLHDEHSARGAVIALPRCECGAQLFLKADYTIKEAWRATLPVINAQGQEWARVMSLGHARNVMTHWLLYERNEASYPPVIHMPPTGASLDGVPQEVFTALWFGGQVQRTRQGLQEATTMKKESIACCQTLMSNNTLCKR